MFSYLLIFIGSFVYHFARSEEGIINDLVSAAGSGLVLSVFLAAIN